MPAVMTPAGRAILFGARPYSAKVLATAPSNLLAYWPLWEASGSAASDLSGNGRNGAYTGVDLGSPGIGDGRTSPLFDGVNDYCNVYSAGLAGAFNKDEGSASIWYRVASAGVYTDATFRRILQFRTDGNNQVTLVRQSTNNQVSGQYIAGGTTKLVNITTSALGWIHAGITWSKSADELRVYLSGVQQGTTQTALGTWSGALTSTQTVLGAQTTVPGQVWNGYLAHAALWSTPLTAAQIAALASVS